MTDRNYSLTKRPETQIVTTAVRQLEIGALLDQEQERVRLKELLARHPELMGSELGRFYPLDMQMLAEFQDMWGLSESSNNKSLPWSVELLERFKEQWNWKDLSENNALPWSLELLVRF